MSAPQDEPVAWRFVHTAGVGHISFTDRPPQDDETEIYKKHAIEVTSLYSASPSAIRSAAIAECARVVGKEYYLKDDRLDPYHKGWNDALEHVRAALQSLGYEVTK